MNSNQEILKRYYKFSQKEQDREDGVYYFEARYYHPITGRFLSVDPIVSGQNWYTYSQNNPILYKDMMGLYTMKAGDTLGDLAYKNKTTVRTILKLNPNITDVRKIPNGSTVVLPGEKIDIIAGIGNVVSAIGNAIGGFFSSLFKQITPMKNITISQEFSPQHPAHDIYDSSGSDSSIIATHGGTLTYNNEVTSRMDFPQR